MRDKNEEIKKGGKTLKHVVSDSLISRPDLKGRCNLTNNCAMKSALYYMKEDTNRNHTWNNITTS